MSTKVKVKADPFAGWTMANVGCHWSRQLPDGRMAHLGSWTNAHLPSHQDYRSGYALTVDYQRADYNTLDGALAAFDMMAKGI